METAEQGRIWCQGEKRFFSLEVLLEIVES